MKDEIIGEVITVGDELLSGKTLNTNSKFICERLLDMSIDTKYVTVVGDGKKDISDAIDLALKRSDIIIFTGGLGPTSDDCTKEIVCKKLNQKLILDNEILDKMKAYFQDRNMEMSQNNIKQAYVPENGIVLKNSNGTAPGILLKYENKILILLPGPPREMTSIFEEAVIPELSKIAKVKIVSRTINTIGIGESKLEDSIKDIIEKYKKTTIATYAREGQVDIRITIKSKDKKEIDGLLENIIEELELRLGEYIYSYSNETIEEVVFKMLSEKKLKIGFCESCTGGLVTSRLTRIKGASNVLDRSIITYSNASKAEEVNVSKNTLRTFGAVSKETAAEMAKGLLNKSNLDLVVSITGIAGPDGGSEEKPKGLVYICLTTKDNTIVEKNLFLGTREQIQNKSADSAFKLIRSYLLKSN